MIESSTSRPMESRRPISVELLSVIPSGTMARSAMPMEIRNRDDRDEGPPDVSQEEQDHHAR